MFYPCFYNSNFIHLLPVIDAWSKFIFNFEIISKTFKHNIWIKQ